jgi:outer membrane immunogenic protein
MLALSAVASLARAQNSASWDGFYASFDIGGANPKACSNSTLNGAAIDPAAASFSSCPGGGVVGGIQFGENFQTKRLVWGLGADLDYWSSGTADTSGVFTGAAPPAGTYGFTGKFSPKEFAILGGHIGYAGNLFMPYVRAGAVLTTGSQTTTLHYLPPGGTQTLASFNAGKNYNSIGWAGGGGVDVGLNGAWSITAEYLHISLGKGADSTTACTGAPGACAAFEGIALESSHTAFNANMFRIGISYWFNYWDKP